LWWFNKLPGRRILEAAAQLKESGKIRFLGVTSHHRPFHGEMAQRPGDPFDVLQARYNAAHRGAENDVFARLGDKRPGIVTYTTTRWGKLLQAKQMPPGEKPLSAAESYRFVLTQPDVNVCLAGPKNEEQMLEGLRALEQGPLDEEALERVRKIGDHVHG
jgi:aryl-alcohol dehydrogenase-like predicted oxidoreductase